MSANLDKSLDEIIDSKRRVSASTKRNVPRRGAPGPRRGAPGPRRVSKQVNDRRRVGGRPRIPGAAVNLPPSSLLDMAYSTRVSVEGLPKDISQDSIKEFFQTAVGGVQRVLLSYNEKGQSMGMATLTFTSNEKARKAVTTYNNSPIDGGKSRLKVQMIIDPTKKPLASRIGGAGAIGPVSRNVSNRGKLSSRLNRNGPRNNNMNNNNNNNNNGPKRSSRPPKRGNVNRGPKNEGKKSLEELDKEMAAYFDKN
ncbi:related to RNA annealing protein YRA1 [Saccharomycodes ludwigii]|uniref:Related to RNA annealing protein YRA1 n=1 Tax=Saccharomycodes ludwigii TaxID=36035 RepID=A0A376B5K1_9ASCO|nr:hypothetical protein SCDLUD_003238 [Saccharomycodes ludwigii]KAH3900266.1 hypothetical protein SCDLUD_003238 [Saccharomycodes ludwigii]SSD59967.1 related to RNA annealing protein YRA1 [Saccharomycodes ludwigii]